MTEWLQRGGRDTFQKCWGNPLTLKTLINISNPKTCKGQMSAGLEKDYEYCQMEQTSGLPHYQTGPTTVCLNAEISKESCIVDTWMKYIIVHMHRVLRGRGSRHNLQRTTTKPGEMAGEESGPWRRCESPGEIQRAWSLCAVWGPCTLGHEAGDIPSTRNLQFRRREAPTKSGLLLDQSYTYKKSLNRFESSTLQILPACCSEK